jgi:hypothetical protein
MRWARPNVNPLLALRGAACSDRWEVAYPRLRAEQRARAARLRQARCRCRPAAVSALPAPPAPVPPPIAAPPPPPPIATPPRPKLIVDGRPTPKHPWRQFGAFRSAAKS